MTNHSHTTPEQHDHYGQFDSGLKSLVKSLQISFIFLVLIIVGMLIYFFSFGGYFTVKKNQEAVIVLRFGKYVDTYVEGWHWFFPYPVNSFVRVKTNQQSVNVDFTSVKTSAIPGMMPNKPLAPGSDKYLLTGDANIVHSRWVLNYRIVSPKTYYFNFFCPPVPNDPDQLFVDKKDGYVLGTRGPRTMLRAMLRDAVIQATSQMEVDDVLTHKQTEYKQLVTSLITKMIDKQKCGIQVVSVELPMIEPPASTKAAFREVTNASNTKSQMIDKAREYQVREQNNVMARTAAIKAEASAYKQEVVSEVKAETIYFEQIFKEYKANPDTVLMVLYNNTLSDVIGAVDQKYILNARKDGGKQEVRIKINPEPVKKSNKSNEGQ
ncbi:MAG: protease modulator HflK [Lentisphaerae bacterium]|nr:protease modulator HflK [Lentisphaerota bacterium]MCP4100216.1 protease modulator HflK [Lentisphaerota bacterium]